MALEDNPGRPRAELNEGDHRRGLDVFSLWCRGYLVYHTHKVIGEKIVEGDRPPPRILSSALEL
jgi:hypothetical protein